MAEYVYDNKNQHVRISFLWLFDKLFDNNRDYYYHINYHRRLKFKMGVFKTKVNGRA